MLQKQRLNVTAFVHGLVCTYCIYIHVHIFQSRMHGSSITEDLYIQLQST